MTTRNDVWQGMLDANRLMRYYAALADRKKRRRQIMQFTLLAAAIFEVFAVYLQMPGFWQATVAFAIALLVMLDFLLGDANKAAVLYATSKGCGDLENEWKALWREVNRNLYREGVSSAQYDSAAAKLEQKLLDVTSVPGYVDLKEDPDLNRRCTEEAYKSVADSYAA